MTDPARMLATLGERLRGAARVTVLTGAGVSAPSGVPTFRGAGGLWSRFKPEELATPDAFARDPRLVWEWYDWRRQAIAACSPNEAHHVLARWSRQMPGFTLITQNVDGLHERAGTLNVVRLHGSIWDLRCSTPCAGGAAGRIDRRVPLPELPPPCPLCHAWLRPDVVWFGESLDPEVWRAAEAATSCEVFLTAGTSAVVYPAASLLPRAKARGAFTAEINLEPTEHSPMVDLAIQGPADRTFAALDAEMR